MNDTTDKFFMIQNLNFKYQRQKLIDCLAEKRTPLTFRFIKRAKKWYVQVIFTWVVHTEDCLTTSEYGTIGLDFNDGFISVSETDYFGNLIHQMHYPLSSHGSSNKASSSIQEKIAAIVAQACLIKKSIVIENLDFKKTKAGLSKKKHSKYNKMIHAFDYSRYKSRMENACFRNNVELILINPAYTSRIGIEKYGDRMKLNRHQAASFVIARKGQGYLDRLMVPPKKTKK